VSVITGANKNYKVNQQLKYSLPASV